MKQRCTRVLWRRTPLAAAVAAALYPATAVYSQALEEVVVTATRRELNVQDVAQSVAVFSTEDIEKLNLSDLEDVINALPSVNMVNALPGRNALVMRGVSTGSDEYRTDSQVSVYLDDQPMTANSQQVDVRAIDIARIESLPGPQGTLFGSSSQTGTLRYITNKPDATKWAAQLDLEGGTTKGGEPSYDVSGWVNLPVTENIAIRGVAYYSREGGYVDNVLGTTLLGDRDNADVVEDDWNDHETVGGRVAARWQINPKWEGTFSVIAQSLDSEGAWETDPALGENKITRFFDEYFKDDWSQVSLNFKGDLGFAELSVTGSYFDRNTDYEWDQASYDQWRSVFLGGLVNPATGDPFYDSGAPLYDTGFQTGTTYNWQKQNRSAYEIRLTSLGESRLKWLAGAFFEDVYDWWDNGAKEPHLLETRAWYYANVYACGMPAEYNISCPLPETQYYYSNIFDRTVKQTAIFGETTYSLTDKWSVTGGARWFEYDRKEFDIYQVPVGLPAFGSEDIGGRLERSGKSSDTVLKFGTEFHIAPEKMLYALFSQGFRLGGSNSIRAAATGLIPLDYKPDKMNNYEIGLKSKWLQNRLLVNLTAFRMEWDDIQLNDSLSPFWLRGTFNGGKAEQKGIEIATTFNVTERLSLSGNLFLADPEFSEDTVYPDETVLEAGTEMPVSPKEKFFISGDYNIPNFRGSNGSLWARASYSYQGKTWKSISAVMDQDPNLRIPSYSTASASLGYSHDSGWETALNVRNLFDEKGFNYLSSATYGLDFGAVAGNDPRWNYLRSLQRPRSVSISFTRKW
jgi:iron complex outermembrane receptor protein